VAHHEAKGGALIGSVMMMPLLLSLLIGTVELARVFTYYTLEKVMYDRPATLARSRALIFASAGPSITAAENARLLVPPIRANPWFPTSPAMFQIAIERYDPRASHGPCDCSATGCDASRGPRAELHQVSLPTATA
jgi:hypothetical protein